MIKKDQKGSMLYYTVLTLGILYSGAVAISLVLMNQIALVHEMSYSVDAFYAADAGAEEVLSRWEFVGVFDEDDQLYWDQWMYVDEETDPGNVNDDYTQMYLYRRDDRVIDGEDRLVVVVPGTYRGTRRAIQLSRPN